MLNNNSHSWHPTIGCGRLCTRLRDVKSSCREVSCYVGTHASIVTCVVIFPSSAICLDFKRCLLNIGEFLVQRSDRYVYTRLYCNLIFSTVCTSRKPSREKDHGRQKKVCFRAQCVDVFVGVSVRGIVNYRVGLLLINF